MPIRNLAQRKSWLVALASGLIVLLVIGLGLLRKNPMTFANNSAIATALKLEQATWVIPVYWPDKATQAAIQDVIHRLDEAQAQAIATNDPNVMAPTATADFYQQQIAINQELVNSGVTEVKLLNLEWGQISVAGNSATATVYETWSTTYDDGTTEQARDRNVYTLVRDNGAWKVQADDHPDQQAASAPNPAPAP